MRARGNRSTEELDREQEYRKPGGNARHSRQELPAVAAWSVDAGGAAGCNQGGVELGGIGIAAGERQSRMSRPRLERENVPLPAPTVRSS